MLKKKAGFNSDETGFVMFNTRIEEPRRYAPGFSISPIGLLFAEQYFHARAKGEIPG